MTIIAAADGSAIGNPGPAGWAWYVDDSCWASGGWAHGTNNMGELMAVLDLLLQTAHVDDDLLVYCDSRYVIDSITKWMPGWKRNGWVKKDKKPVLNVELMKALDTAMAGRRVEFVWVKGHAGHELNEAADVRANAAATSYKEGREPDRGPGFPGASPAGRVPARDERVNQALGGRVGAPAPYRDPVEEPDLFSTLEDATEPDPLKEVIALERSLLTDEVRGDPAAVAALLHPQWQEIGRSGRLWTREEQLAEIGPIGQAGLDVENVREIAPGLVLMVGRVADDRGSSLWTSLWTKENGHWQALHHHGTLAE